MGMESFGAPLPPQENQEELEKPEEVMAEPEIIEEKIEAPKTEAEKTKLEKEIPVTESIKRRGLDFTEDLRTMNGRLGRIDKEAGAISEKTIGGFRIAARNLEDIFSSKEIRLDDAAASFGKLTTSFEDLSLIHDRELRKITEDARKSLVHAIEGSMGSATVLRREENMDQLRRNINTMLTKAEEASFRFKRGAR